ncbi:hypothetical protein [Streptomyces sp. 5-10]|nr:hypothetical protein [Streptomyces sp. 5-10]
MSATTTPVDAGRGRLGADYAVGPTLGTSANGADSADSKGPSPTGER